MALFGFGKTKYSCLCCVDFIFGDAKQMGIVLKKNFEGSHRWIRVNKKVKLDAMFFPSTSEPVDDNNSEAKYK